MRTCDTKLPDKGAGHLRQIEEGSERIADEGANVRTRPACSLINISFCVRGTDREGGIPSEGETMTQNKRWMYLNKVRACLSKRCLLVDTWVGIA